MIADNGHHSRAGFAATAAGVLGLAGAAVVVAACSGRWRG
jgi:hypothetical protein